MSSTVVSNLLPPKLSIIIVSWNVRDLLCQCLHSLQTQRHKLDFEVIVVDGNSHDDTLRMVADVFSWVELIPCDENVGFPKGNNIGLAQARGEYLMLLNPDTVVHEQALERLVAYLDEHPAVGAVGPQLLHSDGSIQSSRRRFPTFWTGVFESTWLQSLAPPSILDYYYVLDQPDEAILAVDWLMGAAIMVRREVVEQVGGLDEDYFMYSEELDWCRRIRDAGWGVVYLPASQITHHVGKSSEQAVTARHINFQRAKLRYFRKYHGWLSALVLRLILLFHYVVQLGMEGVKGVLGHKRALRWQRVQSYWAVLRSGLRPAGY